MTIGIIGLGYVGLTLAIAAASHGIITYGIEINDHIKTCLSKNQAHFYEPHLDQLIGKVNNRTFYCVDQFPDDVPFDAFIITVGTPLMEQEKRPNFEYIKLAVKTVSHLYTGDQLVILRSTVSVGTTRNVVVPLLAQLCNKPQEDILVAMCPERTVEGKAVEELSALPQIISGNNKRALKMARNLFCQISPRIIEADCIEEAELAKLYCNVYRDMTFALGNVLCMAAQTFGMDGSRVIRIANEDYRRTNIPLPGFVAGPCLEKDAYILANNMPDCASRKFILGARQFNESLEDIVVDWVEQMSGPGEQRKTIALSGMAFKGVPETSDLRGSSSVYIAQKLFAKGYRLRFHDYVASPEEIRALKMGPICSTLDEACAEAELLLVLNNHMNYSQARLSKDSIQNKFAVLDVWDVCSAMREDGLRIYTMGNICTNGGQKCVQ